MIYQCTLEYKPVMQKVAAEKIMLARAAGQEEMETGLTELSVF